MASGYPFPGQQKPTGHDVLKNKYFVSDAKLEEIKLGQHIYDLVIIGSGFCGLAAATRALEKNPKTRILLIERGDYFLPTHFQNLGTAYVHTLGGLSETFPWSLSHRTYKGELGSVREQHGMVPFFGGRSILWSAWCPRPTEEEMVGWPQKTIEGSKKYFDAAERLLNVQSADRVDKSEPEQRTTTHKTEGKRAALRNKWEGEYEPPVSSRLPLYCATVKETLFRPLYDRLQSKVGELLSSAKGSVKSVDRVEPARIASDARRMANIDFQKFSTPSALLDLVIAQKKKHTAGIGEMFDIVCGCVVERIVDYEGEAIGLKTSRGDFILHDATIIIAAGTLPATTLVRNSFPKIAKKWPSERFSAHFITSITARVPLYDEIRESPLEVSASYISGWSDSRMQYHIQLSGIVDQKPKQSEGVILRYMPDVVATANQNQLDTSKDHVIFVCAVLGELNHENKYSWFRQNKMDADLTTNSILQIQSDSAKDLETWDTMDRATFEILDLLKNKKNPKIEYWIPKDQENGEWSETKPSIEARRVPSTVHESSTMYIGEEEDAPVDLNYKLRGTRNVYITGGALWPTGGSWNPTLTMVALTMDLIDRLV